MLAMSLNLEEVYRWYSASVVFTHPQRLCQARDIFQARVDSFYRELMHQSVSEDIAALIVAVVGEVGNNCFDHNLGQWQDTPGAWFEHEVTDQMLSLIIADRGQGVFSSLKRIIPNLKNDQEAIETAFEKRVSGRSPEKRGNGLKFVKSVIKGNQDCALLFSSGKGIILCGGLAAKLDATLKPYLPQEGSGTLTFLLWKLKS